MMQLDDVVHVCTTGPRVEEAMYRSIRWLDRCLQAHRKIEKQNIFPIIQGGLDLSLRKKCIDGNALHYLMFHSSRQWSYAPSPFELRLHPIASCLSQKPFLVFCSAQKRLSVIFLCYILGLKNIQYKEVKWGSEWKVPFPMTFRKGNKNSIIGH